MYTYYGGFWRRAIAFLTDAIILYTISITFFISWILITYPDLGSFESLLTSGTTTTIFIKVLVPYYGISILLNMTYFTYYHGTIGQTPGKKLLGLKVIQTTGKQMTLGTAFLRWVGYIISKLVFYLGFIWIIFDGRKQGWHDKIAGTYVIRTKR
jgi:uncharacterized RDD family membrane protein YckC